VLEAGCSQKEGRTKKEKNINLMIKERRKHRRARKHFLLKIADKGFDVITETTDISSAGICCRVSRLLSPMSKIEVILLVPTKGDEKEGKKIRCKGVVVRSEPIILKDVDKAHYNIAIFFTDISKKDRKTLESYVGSGNTANIDEESIKIDN
jgi:hypothetical protein